MKMNMNMNPNIPPYFIVYQYVPIGIGKFIYKDPSKSDGWSVTSCRADAYKFETEKDALTMIDSDARKEDLSIIRLEYKLSGIYVSTPESRAEK